MDIKQIVKDAMAEALGTNRNESEGPAGNSSLGPSNVPPAPAEHPVLTAVFAAGIDTPEKFAALQADLSTARSEATKAQGDFTATQTKLGEAQSEIERLQVVEDRALGKARSEAESAAVRAYADKPEKLEKAKKAIAFSKDLDDLEGMKAVYEEQTPEAFKSKEEAPGRQLGGNEQLSTTSDEAKLYDAIRKDPTSPNPVVESN